LLYRDDALLLFQVSIGKPLRLSLGPLLALGV